MRDKLSRVGSKKFTAFGLLITIVTISLTVYLVNQMQDFRGLASSPDKLETEQGVISGSVQKLSDSLASGGQYVKFASSGTTPVPTTPPSQRDLGPRYDTYGAGTNGNFPEFPTGSNVVVVPSSVPHSTYPSKSAPDATKALSDFINKQPDGTVIVFDQSGGGSGYGAGTFYNLSEFLLFAGNTQGKYRTTATDTFRSNVTLWGYNTRLKNTRTSTTTDIYPTTSDNNGPVIISATAGGFKDCAILGFDLMGPNYKAGTWDARTLGTESGHGIRLGGYSGMTIQDNYIHEVLGDFISLYGDALGTNPTLPVTWTFYYGDYTHDPFPEVDINSLHSGPYSANANISYNLLDGNGRMGIVVNQGYGVWIHHNIVKNVALSSIDVEDGNYNETGYRWVRNLYIEDNHFDGWAWHLPASSESNSVWYTWVYQLGQPAPRVEQHLNYVIRRNRITRGPQGFMNDDAEIARWGQTHPRYAGSRELIANVGADGVTERNIIFQDEVIDIPARIRNDMSFRYGVKIDNWGGTIKLTDNDWQGMDARVYNNPSGTNIIFENNGSSQLIQ